MKGCYMKYTCPKVVIDRRERIRRQETVKRHLRIRWSLLILALIALYIVIQGIMAITKQLIGRTAYAPTIKVYAQIVKPIPSPTVPSLNPNMTELEQNKFLIRKIWGKDQAIGMEIARCESGFRTKGPHVANTNLTIDQGIFSINSVHGMPEMENPVANISTAYLMFKEQGTAPWDSSKWCWNK